MDRNITENLAVTLRYYREKRGLSLEQLSKVSDASASYINRLELGNRVCPSINKLDSISRALNISIECLLGMSNNKNQQEFESFEQLLIRNNFLINGKKIEFEVKEKIIELFEYIIPSNKERDKNERIYELLKKTDDLKLLLQNY